MRPQVKEFQYHYERYTAAAIQTNITMKAYVNVYCFARLHLFHFFLLFISYYSVLPSIHAHSTKNLVETVFLFGFYGSTKALIFNTKISSSGIQLAFVLRGQLIVSFTDTLNMCMCVKLYQPVACMVEWKEQT